MKWKRTAVIGNTVNAFHRRCKPDSVDVDVSAYKSVFVHEHNKRRNFIALGLLPGYYPASRMATMVWDDELQYLSSLNVRTCILDHDDCHNTYRFKNSGQNLVAVYRDRSPFVNVTSLIEQSLNLWFDEYPLIDSTYIDSFKVTKYFEDYGHFAEMVVDRNTHVGCSIMRFTRPDYPIVYIYHIVCNYGSIYALETPVYTIGYPASRCKTGKNPHYPGLCSVKEQINPNY
ncbi:antigen 5 like allergen Cul n 1 [Teleopsis dalmanni]|uniref:antigen 5 like allergen Cul n 1 n=1 Tax=Teleopsis dalmanni TaxID=139649 RepID=UPI0018CE93B7|nr:antigen 5 like allergen Cul n 1 [Teleopsis dalmanni]